MVEWHLVLVCQWCSIGKQLFYTYGVCMAAAADHTPSSQFAIVFMSLSCAHHGVGAR